VPPELRPPVPVLAGTSVPPEPFEPPVASAVPVPALPPELSVVAELAPPDAAPLVPPAIVPPEALGWLETPPAPPLFSPELLQPPMAMLRIPATNLAVETNFVLIEGAAARRTVL
jgi:hypothetical protein